MKILVLGGTAWLGHAIAESALSGGHDVTCVARGAATPRGATLVRADRDRDDAPLGLAETRWDAVVDVARQPGHVRRAVRDLEPVADRYVFVSTVNVYASNDTQGQDEDAALLDPLEADSWSAPEDYGPAKVACEDAVRAAFGDPRSVIVRPGLIGGPGDPTGRTGYWPRRFAHPSNSDGLVLVPDAPGQPTSIIDVRDLAAWVVHLATSSSGGIFNAVGYAAPFSDHIAAARTAAESTATPVPAPEAFLLENAVAPWAGPKSLPLWIGDPGLYGLVDRSNARAIGAGLRLRPLAETLADGLAGDNGAGLDVAHGAGLTDEEERTLLTHLRG